jgi:hypothetical protein
MIPAMVRIGKNYAKATEELKRHQRPAEAIRRVFSREARDECQKAQERVQSAERSMRAEGVTSPHDLERQRSVFGQQQEPRREALKQRQHDCLERMGTVRLAMDGLDHALELVHRLARQRQPERDRVDEQERFREGGRGRWRAFLNHAARPERKDTAPQPWQSRLGPTGMP